MKLKLFTLTLAFLFIATTVSAQEQSTKPSPADYFPLKPNLKYVYDARFTDRTGVDRREPYTITSKQVTRGDYAVTYFTEIEEGKGLGIALDVNMIGLGGYTQDAGNLSTFDCTYIDDLQKIPPKKPHLFLRNPVTTGDQVKVIADAGNEVYIFTVIGFEDVEVPAGSFEKALKLSIKRKSLTGEEAEDFAWFAKGVGMVKRVRTTGRVESLVSADTLNNGAFITRDLAEWPGLKFAFIPKRQGFKRFGYQLIHKPNNQRAGLPYNEYVGKIVRVLKVTPGKIAWTVDLEVEGTKERLIAEAYRGTVNDLAPLADLENARERYLGKTFWTKTTLYTYNEELDELGNSTPSRYAPVKIAEVTWGWEDSAPIRFIVETESGLRAFVDLHLSDTNIPDKLRQYNRFEDAFLTESQKNRDPLEQLRNANDEMDRRLKQRIEEERELLAGLNKKQPSLAEDRPAQVDNLESRIRLRQSPVYPAFAKAARVTGVVTVDVVIDENGRVLSAESTSGPAVLRQSAIDAARATVFEPVQVNNKFVRAKGSIKFEFKL